MFQGVQLTHKGQNEEQPAWVPKFTKVGFERSSIPPDVYAMLLWEYERQKAFMYEEPPPTAIINCKKIREMEDKKQSSLKNMGRTF